MPRNFFLEAVKSGLETTETIEGVLRKLRNLLDIKESLDADDSAFVEMFFSKGNHSFPPLLWMFDFRVESMDSDAKTITVAFNIGGPGGCLDAYSVDMSSDMLTEPAFFRLDRLAERYKDSFKTY